ncbi:MAG: NAD(P)H-hydrate dehydratase, partial [Thermodesulfovibrionales bacterium]
TEEMTLPLPDRGDGTLSSKACKEILDFLSERADVLCIGPGIGVSEDTIRLLTEILISLDKPAVVDADAINSIPDQGLLKECKSPLILTPHPGEMSRLLSKTGLKIEISDIEKDRIDAARSFSEETGAYLVLKGVPTITAGPDGRVYINPTGNPGMATAGAGDVLTGMIGALIGQGFEPLKVAIVGVYLHGLSGDIAAESKGEHSLIASDIIEAIPEAFKRLTCAASGID